MYAHTVIEDLTEFKKNNVIHDSAYSQGIDILIKGVRNSQQFHLGSFQELIVPLEKVFHEKSRPFWGPTSENVRLPYKECWFEFQNIAPDTPREEDVPKRAMLVTQMGIDLIWVWIVNWPKKTRRWLLSPQNYFITIGKKIGEHAPLREMVTAFLKNSNASPEVVKSYYESNIWPQPIIDKMDVKMSQDLCRDDLRDLVALNAAIMLLNCKNIVSEDVRPSSKINKKRRSKGKKPLYTYKILKLVLPSDTKNGAEYSKSGEKTRIHLCRGHFKNYTSDSPLFGKYTGLYWWEAHLRGDKKEGLVNKEYEISTKQH